MTEEIFGRMTLTDIEGQIGGAKFRLSVLSQHKLEPHDLDVRVAMFRKAEQQRTAEKAGPPLTTEERAEKAARAVTEIDASIQRRAKRIARERAGKAPA